MNLAEKFRRLAHALEPLGIEIGPDVLDVWHDRHVHGRDPLPANALDELADTVNVLRLGKPHDPRMARAVRPGRPTTTGSQNTAAAEPGQAEILASQ
jgi:hypothetical protein